MHSPADKKQGVYTHTAKCAVYALAWSLRRDTATRLAVGSFLEDYTNRIQLLDFDPNSGDFTATATLDHPYTPTNLMFYPSEDSSRPDLLAASGDYLRLYQIHHDHDDHHHGTLEPKTLLSPTAPAPAIEFNSAFTSFDWAEFEPHRIAASSIDTTCTIWDVEKETLDTQLVAHDKAVHDVSWGGPGVFSSVSADASVRVFDLRDKERSTIIYENVDSSPLLRLEWNKADPRFMAAVGADSDRVVVLDIRFPTAPLAELRGHKASVNAVSWGPKVGRELCSVGDDSRALIWDVATVGESVGEDVEPVMWYGSATGEINNVRWSPFDRDWIAITFLNKLQLLKV